MAATWPVGLPGPLQNGYGLEPHDQTLRSEMESGSPRVRRITTARSDEISLTFKWSDAQLLAFKNWFYDGVTGLAGGSLWFSGMPMAVGNGIQTTIEGRFVGPHKPSLLPGELFWAVTAKVETR